MSIVNKEFQEWVLDDLKDYESISHPVKASLLERVLVKKIDKEKLHPNPKDEFSDPEIGPNYEIVKKYFDEITFYLTHVSAPEMEPLIVEKMSVGGYMILNGHHRWLAAKRCNKFKKIPIDIVNVSQESDIIDAVNRSDNKLCISIDLDEVLMYNGTDYPADMELIFPFNIFLPGKIRKNAPYMIKELQKNGFDVWVYTGSYKSVQYIDRFLRMHKINVQGIINGMKTKKVSGNMMNAFKEKYKTIVHLDNDSVLIVKPENREFDTYELNNGSEWANDTVVKIKEWLAANNQ